MSQQHRKFKKNQQHHFNADKINEMMEELFPRRIVFSAFHEVFKRTKHDEALEDFKDRTTRQTK